MNLETNLVPFNPDAEMKLCGSLMIEQNEIGDAMVTLRPEFFYTLKGRYIFDAICHLHINGSPVTPDTISTLLSERKEIDKSRFEIIGGSSSIIECLDGVGGGEAEFWAREVHKKYQERQLLEFANEARRIALSNPEDIAKARSSLEEKLVSFSGTHTNSSVSIGVAVPELDARINRYIDRPDDIVGFSTGYSRLDECLDGLSPGNVTIIYAPSSRFKSLFSANIGYNMAREDISGLWFTTEMPRIQVMERLLQLESGLNLKWLRRDKRVYEHKRDLARASYNLSTYPIYFCDTSSLDVSEVRAEVNRHTRWNGIRYILVDLVDHISSSRFKDEMVNNQRVVMASMKQIAKDFDIHVLLVSHVTKGDKDSRKSPDLDVENMIGSAAKYQDVDAAISLAPVTLGETGSWEAMSREQILWEVGHGGKLDVMVSVTKNRHGELLRYIINLDFNRGGRFDEGWIKPKEKQGVFTSEG